MENNNPTTCVECEKPICELKSPINSGMTEDDRHHLDYFCHGGHQPKTCEKCDDHHYVCSASGFAPCQRNLIHKEHNWIPCPSCSQPKEEAKEKCCDKQFVWSGGEGTSHYCCNVHCCVPVQPKEEAKGERCANCEKPNDYGNPEPCALHIPCDTCGRPKQYCPCINAVGTRGQEERHPTNPKKEDWEEELEKFKEWFTEDKDTWEHYSLCLRSLISSALAEARREQHRISYAQGLAEGQKKV